MVKFQGVQSSVARGRDARRRPAVPKVHEQPAVKRGLPKHPSNIHLTWRGICHGMHQCRFQTREMVTELLNDDLFTPSLMAPHMDPPNGAAPYFRFPSSQMDPRPRLHPDFIENATFRIAI